MIMWSAGAPERLGSTGPPTLWRLAHGDFLRVAVEGRYAGYCGQATQMAVLSKVPPVYRDMWRLQQEAVQLCCEDMRLSITLGELARRTGAVAQGTPCRIKFLMGAASAMTHRCMSSRRRTR